jgi:hypothetical protein
MRALFVLLWAGSQRGGSDVLSHTDLPVRSRHLLDDNARVLRAVRFLRPFIAGYVVVILGLVAWAVLRPDHPLQYMPIMGAVIVSPFLTLVGALNRSGMSAVALWDLVSSVPDDDGRVLRAARFLRPFIAGYVVVILGLVAWAVLRPDHPLQYMPIMGAVIESPFLTLVAGFRTLVAVLRRT